VGSMVVFMVAASRWFWAESTRVFFDPPSALSRPERIVGRGGRGGANESSRPEPDGPKLPRFSRERPLEQTFNVSAAATLRRPASCRELAV
jgi:hypothetical protein